MRGYIVSEVVNNLLLKIFMIVVTSVILIAWYDIFCERKDEQKNLIIPMLWYVSIDLVLISCIQGILQKYLPNNETRQLVTGIQFVQEIILECLLLISKYRGSFKKKFLLYLPYIIGIPAIGMFIQSILNVDLIVARKGSYYIEAINNVTLLIATYLVILIIGETYRSFKYKKNNPQFVFFAVILAAQVVLHYIFEKAFLTLADEGKMNWYLIGYIFSAIILLCVGAIYQNHLRELEYKRFESERQRIWEQRADYYQVTSKATTELKKMEHDFKKHLLIIGQLAKANRLESLDDYLNDVVSHVSPSNKMVDAGNLTLSAILTLMAKRCSKNDIAFKYNLEYKELRINDFDLSTIMGNILENAFEASIKIEDASKRHIKLSIQEKRGIILIICRNYYVDKIKDFATYIKRDNEDEGNHGLGLINVRDAVKKYDGEVVVETKSQQFEIQIVI